MSEYKYTKIIAVDFDGTLCENAWPKIGRAHSTIIEILKEKRSEGVKLILWTNRTGALLEEAVDWCKERGLEFDAVNENLPEIITAFKGDTRKIFANVYLDDRSITLGAFIEDYESEQIPLF